MTDEEFGEHVITYLRENEGLAERSILTNFIVIATSVNLDDRDVSSVSIMPSEDLPFAYQLGVLEYALTRHRLRVEQDTLD